MENAYRVRYRSGDLEVEVESSDKKYVDSKVAELLNKGLGPKVQTKRSPPGKKTSKPTSGTRRRGVKRDVPAEAAEESVDIPGLVDAIKESKHFRQVTETILKKRSQLPRVLMCFYFAKEFLDDPRLTTGEVETITDQLDVKIKRQNVGIVIKNNLGFFSTDQVRKRGAIVRYKLNRQGIEAFQKYLKGAAS